MLRSKGREWARTLIPLDSGVAQGVKWGKCRPTLLRWRLLSKEMRSNVWCPKRRLTWSQALFDNIQSVPDRLREGRSAGFSPAEHVNIKSEIAFHAWMKNVFKNAADFGALAASIVKGRLEDAVVGVNVHSWRGKVFPKRKERMQ